MSCDAHVLHKRNHCCIYSSIYIQLEPSTSGVNEFCRYIIIFIYNIKLYVTTNIMYKMFQKYIVRVSIVLACSTESFVTEENVDGVHNSTRGSYSGFEKYLHLL